MAQPNPPNFWQLPFSNLTRRRLAELSGSRLQTKGKIMNTTKARSRQTPSLLVDDHVGVINKCWTTADIVELSLACCKANNEWKPKSRKRLIADLPFGKSTFSKCAKIGADLRLTDPKRRHLLPAKVSALYELHQLTDREFRAFEAEGLLTPRLRRVDVARWRSRQCGVQQASTFAPKLASRFYAGLKPNRQLAGSEVSRLDAGLTALAQQFEMDVVYPATKPRVGVWERGLREMRREAKTVVAKHLKKLREKVGPSKFKSRPELRKYAGFLADEVEIEADADEERILEVLKTIGHEDEFERIREAVYHKYPVDGPCDAPAWMDAVADRPPPAAAMAADMEELKEQLRAAAKRKPSLEQMKARLVGVK
jgi:hypothetical protein